MQSRNNRRNKPGQGRKSPWPDGYSARETPDKFSRVQCLIEHRAELQEIAHAISKDNSLYLELKMLANAWKINRGK